MTVWKDKCESMSREAGIGSWSHVVFTVASRAGSGMRGDRWPLTMYLDIATASKMFQKAREIMSDPSVEL